MSSEEMLRESAANTQAAAAFRGFIGGVDVSLVPMIESSIPPFVNRDVALAQSREARARTESLKLEATQASAKFLSSQQAFAQAKTAFYLTTAGFKIQPKEFGLPERATTLPKAEIAAKFAMEEATAVSEQEMKKLDGFAVALRARLQSALQLMQQPGAQSEETLSQLKATLPLLVAVGATMPALRQLAATLRPFATLAQNRANHSNPLVVDTQILNLVEEMGKLLADVQSPLGGLPYPFPHPRGKLTLIEYASYEKRDENQWLATYHQSNSHVERLFALHYRLFGLLLAAVEVAEKDFEKPAVA